MNSILGNAFNGIMVETPREMNVCASVSPGALSKKHLPNIMNILDDNFTVENSKQKKSSAIADGNSGVLCKRLQKLEETISQHLLGEKHFYLLGNSLKEIKEKKLYCSVGYKSFRKYCKDKFNLSKTYYCDLIKATAVYESVKEAANSSQITVNESHCRELSKIKDLEMRQKVLKKAGNAGTVTAKEISKTYRDMRLKLVASKGKPVLPEVGQTIRLTTKLNKELALYNGYWAIVTEKNEFTCEARGLCFNNILLSSQDFIALGTCRGADKLLDRLIDCYYSRLANDAVHAFIETIAKRPYPLLEDVDDILLVAIEQEFCRDRKVM